LLPNNDHPVIRKSLRMSGGATNDQRFEQIGQSSVSMRSQPCNKTSALWLTPTASTTLVRMLRLPYTGKFELGRS